MRAHDAISPRRLLERISVGLYRAPTLDRLWSWGAAMRRAWSWCRGHHHQAQCGARRATGNTGAAIAVQVHGARLLHGSFSCFATLGGPKYTRADVPGQRASPHGHGRASAMKHSRFRRRVRRRAHTMVAGLAVPLSGCGNELRPSIDEGDAAPCAATTRDRQHELRGAPPLPARPSARSPSRRGSRRVGATRGKRARACPATATNPAERRRSLGPRGPSTTASSPRSLREIYVHNLEHGAIVPRGTGVRPVRLRRGEDGAGRGAGRGRLRSEVPPGAGEGPEARPRDDARQRAGHPVAAAAWEGRDVLPRRASTKTSLARFVADHYGMGPEDTCSDAGPSISICQMAARRAAATDRAAAEAGRARRGRSAGSVTGLTGGSSPGSIPGMSEPSTVTPRLGRALPAAGRRGVRRVGRGSGGAVDQERGGVVALKIDAARARSVRGAARLRAAGCSAARRCTRRWRSRRGCRARRRRLARGAVWRRARRARRGRPGEEGARSLRCAGSKGEPSPTPCAG